MPTYCGSGLVTPQYDITFSRAANVERYSRRGHRDPYEDFALPAGTEDPVVFVGGRDYIPLFCRLTANAKGPRTVFYAGSEIAAPGCRLERFGDPFTNWHYQCARALVQGRMPSHESAN